MVRAPGAGMIAGAMEGWRNPARYIVPLALAASVTATYLIVHHAVVNKHAPTTTTTVRTSTAVAHHNGGHTRSPSGKAKFYVVKPGDIAVGDRGEDRRADNDDRGAEPTPESERAPALAATSAAAVRCE